MENHTYMQLLKEAFEFLFEDYNYQVAHHIAANAFWNAQTFLQSKDLIIEIVNDWCQISLYLKPYDPRTVLKKQLNNSYDFLLILSLLAVPEKKELDDFYKKNLSETFSDDSGWCNIVEKESGITQLELLANILEKYYGQIIELFSEEQIADTKTKLTQLKKAQAKNL